MKTQLLFISLALAACGNTRDAQQQVRADTSAVAPVDTVATGPKACELLSAADIERITHAVVQAGVVTNDYAGDSQCRFDLKTDGKPGVMVTLHAHGNIEPYRKVPDAIEISDIGDLAVWSETNAQLAVRHGDAVFSISFLSRPAKQSWALELARVALQKLSPV